MAIEPPLVTNSNTRATARAIFALEVMAELVPVGAIAANGALIFLVSGEVVGFHGPGSALLPESDGDLFDDGEFEGGLRGEVG